MTTQQSSDVVTVLAVSPGHETVIRTIEEWTAAGLLRSALLVDDALLSGPIPDKDALTVRRVERSGTVTQLLRETLGTRPLKIMRFVAVRPIIDDDRTNVDSGRINAIADAFEETLSRRTRLVRINLVIPDVAGVQRLPTLLEPRWDVNVVASPEDRPNDDAIDHGVSRPDAYAPHAALACATIAGLWEHVPAGPFDDPETARMVGNHRRIVVARTAVRVVDNRDLSDQVINNIVRADTTALLAPDVADRGEGVVRSSPQLVEEAMWAFRENAQKQPFDFHAQPEPKIPPPAMLKYTAKGLARALRQLLRRQIEGALAGVLGLTEGAVFWLAGSIPIFGDRDDSWNIPGVAPTPKRIHEMAESAPGLLGKRAPLPGKEVWQPLRQMCFGLVDRGDLPQEIMSVVGGRRPLVSAARWIVPSPIDSFTFTFEEIAALKAVGKPCGRVRATDLNAAAHVRIRLSDALRLAENSPRGDEDENDIDIDKPTAVVDAALVDTLRACRARFVKWDSRSRSLSLIGQLTNHVNAELLKAREDLERRARDYQQAENDRQTVHALMNESFTTVRRYRWVGPTGLLSAVAGVGSLFVPLASLWALPLPLTLTTLVFGGWWAARTVRYLAREVQLERELARIEARRRAIIAAVQRWPTEADRLASVYDALTDWGEIIGWMVHKPFGSGAELSDEIHLDSERLPQAFQFARTGQLDAVIQRLVRRMSRDVFGRAWVMNLYVHLAESFLSGPVAPAGSNWESDPDYSPTLDASEDDTQVIAGASGRGNQPTGETFGEYADIHDKPPVHNPRAQLVRYFRDEMCGKKARDTMSTQIRQAMRKLPVEELAEKVTIQRGDVGEPEMVGVREFLHGVLPQPTGSYLCPPLAGATFTLSGAVRDKSIVDRVQLWCPESLATGDVPNTDRRSADPRVVVTPDTASDGRHLVQVTRLDFSEDCEPSDILVFAEPSMELDDPQ